LTDREGDAVSRSRPRPFHCAVVSEEVLIRLRRWAGFGKPPGYFVQCDQVDCQYVDENKPPCPLHIGMFADEIRAAEEARAPRDDR
jgi:hypothetical protein